MDDSTEDTFKTKTRPAVGVRTSSFSRTATYQPKKKVLWRIRRENKLATSNISRFNELLCNVVSVSARAFALPYTATYLVHVVYTSAQTNGRIRGTGRKGRSYIAGWSLKWVTASPSREDLREFLRSSARRPSLLTCFSSPAFPQNNRSLVKAADYNDLWNFTRKDALK